VARNTPSFDARDEPGNRWLVIAAVIVGVLLLGAALVALYHMLFDTVAVTVKDDKAVFAVQPMLPPPPPPPPPPPEPKEKPPEPSEEPKPMPEAAAPPKPDAPAPMQNDAPAQAGTDAYGVKAGSGGGQGGSGSGGTCLTPPCGTGRGGGFSDGLYRQYLKSALQEAVSRDSRVNRLVFTADLEIVVTPAGRIEHVALRNGSGKGNVDDMLKQILERVSGLRPPPVSSQYPVVIQVRGRNQFGG
jgi:hypothetical protein